MRWVKIAVIVVSLTLIVLTIFFFKSKKLPDSAKATAGSFNLTSQAEWQAGIGDSGLDDTTNPGSIRIANESLITDGSYSIDTPEIQNVNNVTDGNHATSVFVYGNDADTSYGVTLDIGSNRYISKIRWYGDCVSGSKVWNGSVWVNMAQACGGLSPDWSVATIATGLQYSKARLDHLFMGALNIIEMEVYEKPRSAIHTTASTQIDGGANFWQWENFTDTKTVPANTSVIYRYRTSTDSTTWTSWVADIGSVTSRVGDTKYRYLQVEATLSNTDGTSTPTIDSYSIGYHTNQPPNKPTAMTAVVN